MDCNLHHALWNPPTYSHTHREAEDLILTMGEAGLDLRSEKGIPTFYPANPAHANTTVDLLWLSAACHGWATSCTTEVDHTYSHLSDHAAILTELTLPDPVPVKTPAYRRWKKFAPETFEANLAAALKAHSAGLDCRIASQAELDARLDLLTRLVTQTSDTTLPLTTARPNTKRWWDPDILNPLEAKSQQL